MTRLYLPASSAAPGISPAAHPVWDVTTFQVRVLASPTKTGTPNTLFSVSSALAVDTDVPIAQILYALPTGIAFTTTDLIWGQVRVSESNGNANYRSQFTARVLDSTGTTVRATLYGGDLTTFAGNPPSEWATTSVNRQMPRGTNVPVAVNYTTVAGDWLVLELGFRRHSTNGTSYVGNMRFNDDNALDMPLDETETTQYNTWVEFSTDLVTPAVPPTVVIRHAMMIS